VYKYVNEGVTRRTSKVTSLANHVIYKLV